MKRVSIKCWVYWVEVDGEFNVPVHVPVAGHGYGHACIICSACGERFVFDAENPALNNFDIPSDLSGNCPTCQKALSEKLKPYPEFLITPKGNTGSFHPNTLGGEDVPVERVRFFALDKLIKAK